jgi:hypothetical protein
VICQNEKNLANGWIQIWATYIPNFNHLGPSD